MQKNEWERPFLWRKPTDGPWDFHAVTLRSWRGSEKVAPEAGGDQTDGTKLEWEAASQSASGKAARESIEEEWGRGTGNGSHKEFWDVI